MHTSFLSAGTWGCRCFSWGRVESLCAGLRGTWKQDPALGSSREEADTGKHAWPLCTPVGVPSSPHPVTQASWEGLQSKMPLLTALQGVLFLPGPYSWKALYLEPGHSETVPPVKLKFKDFSPPKANLEDGRDGESQVLEKANHFSDSCTLSVWLYPWKQQGPTKALCNRVDLEDEF